MIGLALVLALPALSAQQVPPLVPAGGAAPVSRPGQAPEWDNVLVVTGAVVGGRLPFSALQLGDGGVDAERIAEQGDSPATDASGPRSERGTGRFVTTGGILVRAQVEGVKLDFPSSAEILLTPSGRLCLRSGEATLPDASGVQLWFADGSVLTSRSATGAGRPHQLVHVSDRSESRFLWISGRRASHATAGRRAFRGSTYVALGDGRVLYRLVQLGPLLVLDRVLCPNGLAPDHPLRQVVVVGDVLAGSLRLLPKLVPPHSNEYPQARQDGQALAMNADRLFPAGVLRRPRSAFGPMNLELPGGFRLGIEVRGRGPVAVGLFQGSDDEPIVEWTVTQTTRLHMIIPGGGRDGRPRYLMRGIDLGGTVDALLAMPRSNADVSRARGLLVQLGAVDPGHGRQRLVRDSGR